MSANVGLSNFNGLSMFTRILPEEILDAAGLGRKLLVGEDPAQLRRRLAKHRRTSDLVLQAFRGFILLHFVDIRENKSSILLC